MAALTVTRHLVCWIIGAILTITLAQFPPPPEGVTVQAVESTPGVSISYNETFVCETQARAWAGYIHVPTSVLSDIETDEPHDISMFFWYFEARGDPQNAPTAMYLAGGPGDPSSGSVFYDGGPCIIQPDSKTTILKEWSWNTYVNMLYIDQPVSTGFSYTKPVNSTSNLLFTPGEEPGTGITPFTAYGGHMPPQNTTFLYDTFSEQNRQKTANSTLTAAKTLWHFS